MFSPLSRQTYYSWRSAGLVVNFHRGLRGKLRPGSVYGKKVRKKGCLLDGKWNLIAGGWDFLLGRDNESSDCFLEIY